MSAKKATAITIPEETEAPAEVTYSAKDLAKELGIDAKSFRRWLRSQTPDRANKGGRWIFDTESKAAWLNAYNTRSHQGTEPSPPDAD